MGHPLLFLVQEVKKRDVARGLKPGSCFTPYAALKRPLFHGTPRLSARHGRGQEQRQGQERRCRISWFPPFAKDAKDGPPSFISCAGSQKTRRSSGAEARFVFCALGGAEAAALPRYSEAFGMTRARSRTTSRSRAVLQESVVPHPFGKLRAGSFAKYAKGWGSFTFLGDRRSKAPLLAKDARNGAPLLIRVGAKSRSKSKATERVSVLRATSTSTATSKPALPAFVVPTFRKGRERWGTLFCFLCIRKSKTRAL